MDLKYDDIQAFLKVYQSGTFTKAAKEHGLTQSALSQKIARLEQTLNAALFVRHPRSLSLTASGEKLYLYAKEITTRQEEFLKNFDQYNSELSGVIRIAGFSSIMRSMIMPKLFPFLRENPKVQIEFMTFEMFELENVLKTNKADFIITDYYPSSANLSSNEIGEEEYVIIEAKKYMKVPNIFIDHGPHDNATESYFKFLSKTIDYERIFMDDVYSIIEGVENGLGRAVMSKHLIENNKKFNILKEKKRYIRPVVLSNIEQSYYSPLQKKVCELLL
jgi:DNA-binding transcriptional LysR family regulator